MHWEDEVRRLGQTICLARFGIGVALLALAWGASVKRASAEPRPPDQRASAEVQARASQSPCLLRAALHGIVSSATATYLARALHRAETEHCIALLVLIDTPGGSLNATQTIVRMFLDARVPVLAYVAPGGARAGSAGALITLAAHLAAMAPGTTIGAARPVARQGRNPEQALGKTPSSEMVNNAAALARAIAEQRGRNVAWAETAVRQSISATAREAVALHLTDLIAGSVNELLDEADGRSVALPQGRVRLTTAAAVVRPINMDVAGQLRSLLGQPTFAYLLLLLGLLGIVIELASPGLIVPGVIGAVTLLLAALGLEMLPINLVGILLIVTAIGLFVLEFFFTSYGLLTLGGMIALLLGSALLLDRTSPDFFADASVSLTWAVVLPLIVVFTIAAAGLAWQARRNRHRRSPTGREGLLGSTGRAITEVTAEQGMVKLHGERWQARAEAPISAGTRVRVVDIEGLSLKVRPA